MKRVPPTPRDSLYCFGLFVADPVLGYVHCNGEEVVLPHRAFEVLLALLKRAGEVVDKEVVFNEVWPGIFVEDNNLARQVSLVRKALRSRDASREYIVTAQGRGYRFVEPVTIIERGLDLAPTIIRGPRSLERVAPAPPGSAIGSELHRRWGLKPTGWRFAWVMAPLLVAFALLRLEPASSSPEASTTRLRQVTWTGTLDGQPTWSPDGQRIAYGSDRDGDLDIWMQSIDGDESVQLTQNPGPDWQPAWSPDGRRIAFRSERDGGGVFAMPVGGGPAQLISPIGYRPRWSPDGTLLLLDDHSRGARRRPLIVELDGRPGRTPRSEIFEDWPGVQVEWERSASLLSAFGSHPTYGPSFWSVPLDGGPAIRWTEEPGVRDRLRALNLSLVSFVWSPDGRSLVFEAESGGTHNLWRVGVDYRDRRWTTGPERLTSGTAREHQAAVSPDGRLIAFSAHHERSRAWTLPLDLERGTIRGPGEPVSLAGTDTFVVDVARSGNELSYRTVRLGRDELWVQDLNDKTERLVAAEAHARILQPRWSADGKRLAYLRSARTGDIARDVSLVLVETKAPAERQSFAVPGAPTHVYDWQPDGAAVLVGCRREGSPLISICRVPVVGSRPGFSSASVVASDRSSDLFAARYSSDQRWLAFVSVGAGRPGTSMVRVMPSAGGPWVDVSTGATYDDKPRWSPDGHHLYFLSRRSSFWNVWSRRWNSSTGTPEGPAIQVTSFLSPARMVSAPTTQVQFSVVRDQLVLPISESNGSIWVTELPH